MLLKKQQQLNQQQPHHHHQGPSSNQQHQMKKEPQSSNRQQAYNQVEYHQQKHQIQQQTGLTNHSMAANNSRNGSASYSTGYPIPNVSSSTASTSPATYIGKNQFQENGSNTANVSMATINTSHPPNSISQQPPAAMVKRVAPNRLDPSAVSGTSVGIEPINIGVTPTDIKLLSDMGSSGIVLMLFITFYFCLRISMLSCIISAYFQMFFIYISIFTTTVTKK